VRDTLTGVPYGRVGVKDRQCESARGRDIDDGVYD
jgi:hypothetical protein